MSLYVSYIFEIQTHFSFESWLDATKLKLMRFIWEEFGIIQTGRTRIKLSSSITFRADEKISDKKTWNAPLHELYWVLPWILLYVHFYRPLIIL